MLKKYGIPIVISLLIVEIVTVGTVKIHFDVRLILKLQNSKRIVNQQRIPTIICGFLLDVKNVFNFYAKVHVQIKNIHLPESRGSIFENSCFKIKKHKYFTNLYLSLFTSLNKTQYISFWFTELMQTNDTVQNQTIINAIRNVVRQLRQMPQQQIQQGTQ